MIEIHLRRATLEDIDPVRFLYRDTIIHINSKDYIAAQIEYWSSGHKHIDAFRKKINEQEFFVAESEKKILGFASLTRDGYFDFMYVHKDFQGKGVGKKLAMKIEETAKALKVKKITSDVSITAKSFFEKCGYKKTGETKNKYGEVVFVNKKMEKAL